MASLSIIGLLCIAFALLDLQTANGKSTKATQPNIVYIMTDDQGYFDTGYQGSEIRTPNIDKLAAEGVTLQNYYVQPVCTPSRSQLLTGRYQIHTGVQDVLGTKTINGLPLQFPTMAEKLREVGYSTHLVGKWHVGYSTKDYTPTFRGFDTFNGYYNAAIDYFDHNVRAGFDFHENTGTTDEELTVDWDSEGKYTTTLFTRQAQRIIETHDQEKPLFLYIAQEAPHFPLQALPRFLAEYEFIEDEDRRTYAAMVTCVDESIGNITATLQENGLWDNTVLVFSSDNGGDNRFGGSNYPLRGRKGGYYEGGVHALGFVASPLLTTGGWVNEELYHISDWFPTFVGLAGGSTEGLDLDGFDIWNSIANKDVSPRTELLHNIDTSTRLVGENLFPDIFDTRVQAAIRVGDYKLLTGNPGNDEHFPKPGSAEIKTEATLNFGVNRERRQSNIQNVRLYNIKDDPSEYVDLSESRPEIVLQLLERLAYYNSTAVPPIEFEADSDHSPDTTGGAWVPWRDNLLLVHEN